MYKVKTEKGLIVRHQNQFQILQEPLEFSLNREIPISQPKEIKTDSKSQNYNYVTVPIFTDEMRSNSNEAQLGLVHERQDISLHEDFVNSETQKHIVPSPNYESYATPIKSQDSTPMPAVETEEIFPPRRVQFNLPELERNQEMEKYLGVLDESGWRHNPLVLGSYSILSMESDLLKLNNSLLASPLTTGSGKPVVMFAGEATHPHYYSTVHGAISSGQREAHRLIDYLKGKCKSN